MGSACPQCLRIFLVIYNFLVVLIGLVILGFAVFAYLEPAAQELIEASGSRVIATTVIFILMGIGTLTLIVALFGCCGAYHESAGLLATYFTFLIIIFTVQVVGATLGYVYRDQLLVDSEPTMRRGVDEYFQQVNPNTKVRFMDSVQKLLKCCGVTHPRDYRNHIPLACCNITTSSCQTTPIEEEHVYSEGCIRKYKLVAEEFLHIFFLVIVGITVFEIFGLFTSIIMCCSVRKYNTDYYEVDYAANA
ncbi:cd9 antigen [Sparganum proliferum]